MSDNVAIKVENVYKFFKLPHEKQSSIKSLFINMIKGSNRTFEKQEVLNDISFEINKGEFFGIVGRNGSGKSTLLKLLAGIYAPSSGIININGKLTPFIELGVGFNPELTGKENVYLSGALLGFSRKEIIKIYDDIVDFAELGKFMDQKLKNYSSGMEVRLAFSIAIRAKGDVLVLDEVLAVGDAAFQQKCFDYFEEIKKSDKTIILVTHNMPMVERFCTKAMYIKDGKIEKFGSPREVADLYTVENIKTPQEQLDDQSKSPSRTFRINSKIISQKYDSLKIEFSYKSNKKDDMYVGISVQKDGMSIAEITTSIKNPIKGNGEVVYTLNTNIFNGGAYRIGAGLFKLANKELVAVSDNQTTFVIEHNDSTLGSAVRLEDTWDYK